MGRTNRALTSTISSRLYLTRIYHIELASFSEEYLKNLETLMKLKEGQNTICEYELVTSDYEDLVRFISQAEELQDQMR